MKIQPTCVNICFEVVDANGQVLFCGSKHFCEEFIESDGKVDSFGIPSTLSKRLGLS